MCRACVRQIHLVEGPACHTCGFPFYGALAGAATCVHCDGLSPKFSEGRTLFLTRGPGRDLIHELKYRQSRFLLNDLARLVAKRAEFQAYFRNASLVPVPLHPAKLRERGFNQSELIADMLVSVTTAAGSTRILERRRYTQTQTHLKRSARQRNVKNAFALVKDASVIEGHTYILIDDVFTTGSTLNACAEVLRLAGASTVKVATLGHG